MPKVGSKIVYGKAQGGLYEIVESGMYKGIKWEIGNNRGTYPFATIYVDCVKRKLVLPSNIFCLGDNSMTWCYADDEFRLGDYRQGMNMTVEEILDDIKSVIDQIVQ